ncbi:MAG: hypothetical protein V4547_16950 [Bacteroidota bacterium]
MSYTLTKISGVLFIQDSNLANPKSYFNSTGRYMVSSDNTTVQLSISDYAGQTPDLYTFTLGSVTIGTSTPSTISSLKVLLNSIFGT